MRRSVLMTSMLSAWAMAIAYYQIREASGVELTVLLCAAVITMIFGLYTGLRASNKQESKEEL